MIKGKGQKTKTNNRKQRLKGKERGQRQRVREDVKTTWQQKRVVILGFQDDGDHMT